VVRDLQVNGKSVGEGGLNAALAAWYGVPVVAVSGDDVAVDEVKSSVPAIHAAVVKRAINTRAVELRPLAEARTAIQTAARDGVRSAAKPARERLDRYQVRMQFRNFNIPEVASAFSEMTVVAPDTVEYSRATMPEAYRLVRVLYRYINPD
jgi:D-amino peptidase